MPGCFGHEAPHNEWAMTGYRWAVHEYGFLWHVCAAHDCPFTTWARPGLLLLEQGLACGRELGERFALAPWIEEETTGKAGPLVKPTPSERACVCKGLARLSFRKERPHHKSALPPQPISSQTTPHHTHPTTPQRQDLPTPWARARSGANCRCRSRYVRLRRDHHHSIHPCLFSLPPPPPRVSSTHPSFAPPPLPPGVA